MMRVLTLSDDKKRPKGKPKRPKTTKEIVDDIRKRTPKSPRHIKPIIGRIPPFLDPRPRRKEDN